VLSLILVIIAAIANAIGDKIQFHWDSSIFSKRGWDSWANPRISWSRKWSWKGKKFDEIDKESFPGSSTVFVFLTDLWHFTKFIQLSSLFAAIVFYQPIIEINSSILKILIDYSILRISYGISFEIFFSKILTKK
jgi:hypothetical protein